MALRRPEAVRRDDVVRASEKFWLVPAHAHCSSRRTCFYAGATFAPKLKVKGFDGKEVSIQTFLQTAFLEMWELVAKTLGNLEAVLGFEVREFCRLARPLVKVRRAQMMNEPHKGYVQLPSMHEFDYNTELHLGHMRACLAFPRSCRNC